jgi:hypothetical protein
VRECVCVWALRSEVGASTTFRRLGMATMGSSLKAHRAHNAIDKHGKDSFALIHAGTQVVRGSVKVPMGHFTEQSEKKFDGPVPPWAASPVWKRNGYAVEAGKQRDGAFDPADGVYRESWPCGNLRSISRLW